ncbi:S-adenosyl-L-methionine-dependent methyltransferase [Mycena haematopus]|nr:S-adenosyl-L-methionine-dependent methyltransferase [Mycena haematopus]
MQRLDELHLAFTKYFGGKLCPISLDEMRPTRILELGCGSGAWAIQAATQFPAAQILAVDRSPLPNRYIPPNLIFQIADLSKAVDFGPDKFDLVHARFVLSHVSNGQDAFRRFARLIRPGGLLLAEDLDMLSWAETAGPASRLFISTLKPTFDERGADMEFGKKISDMMSSLGDFHDVQCQKITMPFSGTGPDAALNDLGLAMKKTFLKSLDPVAGHLAPRGFTPEMALEFREELETNNGASVDTYFGWARRTLE